MAEPSASPVVVTVPHQAEAELFPPPEQSAKRAHVSSFAQYQSMYARSLSDSDAFWREQALATLDWFVPFTSVQSGSFEKGDVAWFLNGRLNASYNCVDRHVAAGRGNKVALLWEGDEPSEVQKITYSELLEQVCKCANALKRMGVRKGDSVCIYMPMVPAAAVAMLACARLGAPHSIVFAGFSADALRDRIVDGHCRFVITADEGRRGGKTIPLKATTDAALAQCPDVKHCLVYAHTGADVHMHPVRDIAWKAALDAERGYAPCEYMDSEDTLFMLFTSGSTGKPKGITHSTGGYLLYAALTTKYVFDIHEDDIHCCAADIGWVTGHSYIIYGPLALGATTFMFESTPLYPDHNRYWQMVQRHKLTTLYTAPTALRALMRYPTEDAKRCDRSSLRVLGSVGEPINPEVFKWYADVAGDNKIPICDTYWQTETGGHVLTPLPGATPTKPGSATLPFFGIEPVVLSADKGEVISGNDVEGVLALARPFPGLARSIYGDHQRYLLTYMTAYKGYYFTGDGVRRDKDGYYWITGRVDDVVNVSGHRIGSAEVESALVTCPGVAEAAVVGMPHDLKGQCLFAYVSPKIGQDAANPAFIKALSLAVRAEVGGFAVPDHVLVTSALPKTRSGKIMRRLLRKIACRETDSLGDTSTLADESVVQTLITQVNAVLDAAEAKAKARK